LSAAGIKIWFDGGCQPNPGPIEVAAVLRGICTFGDDLGTGDNTAAEWLALLHAMDLAASMGLRDVILIGDSRCVVRQASGAVKCRNTAHRQHLEAFRLKSAAFERVRLRHVGRSHNLAGIALERRRSGLV
jgi:ribonuclease HI